MAGSEDNIIKQLAQQLQMSAADARRNFTLDPFTFVVNFLPLAASNTATLNFITQADSGFAIVKTAFTIASDVSVFIANISDTPKYAPLVITLSDSGSGRDLSNAAVPINTYFGTGERPFLWCRPKVLDPNSTFTSRLQNLVATAFNVRLSFHGFKIFGDVASYKGR
ncbi:MAG: hypothetical protein ACRDL7_00475 [Gaiellaceae bacterium]